MKTASRVAHMVARLAAILKTHVSPKQRLLLAYSGGLDSRALLHMLCELRAQIGFELHAMYVHHGLSPNADDWARFCEETCAASDVPICVARVSIEPYKSAGIEAAARLARYQALLDTDADLIVLAQHQDDQVETLLLQLLRGSGVKGLAAMPMFDQERRLLRPLLDVPREELHRYAIAHGLNWIEDESNLDRRYDRNFLRHEILPLIEARFKGAKQVLARTASHMAESALLLDELAEIDIARAGLSKHEIAQHLPLDPLRQLTQPRARNLLRWWLALNRLPMPSTVHLGEIMNQLIQAREDARVGIKLDESTYIRRYRDAAYVDREHSPAFALVWSGEPVLNLPDGSHLRFEKHTGAGLSLARLAGSELRVTVRTGGEKFRPDSRRPTRKLKQLLKEAGIPPWERERLPLIYIEDTLVAVPGIGIASVFQAEPHEEGLVISWCRPGS